MECTALTSSQEGRNSHSVMMRVSAVLHTCIWHTHTHTHTHTRARARAHTLVATWLLVDVYCWSLTSLMCYKVCNSASIVTTHTYPDLELQICSYTHMQTHTHTHLLQLGRVVDVLVYYLMCVLYLSDPHVNVPVLHCWSLTGGLSAFTVCCGHP